MWLVIGLTMILLFNLFNKPQLQHVDISYSDFVNSVQSGAITKVTIEGDQITGTLRGGNDFKTVTPDDSELIPMLRKNGVDISVKEKEDTPWYVTILVSWFPMLLLIGVWIFFMRQMQGGGRGALSFGKTRARLMEKGETKVTFRDVAGIEEAKEELSEIIDFLKDPKKFTRLGGRIPKGVLLAGAPGTGKTLLAKAIAGEAEVPFFTISGSDFVEMFVGVGASRVRDAMMNGSRPLISCWWKWTALNRARVSLSWQPPTDRMSLIRPCSVPDVLTGRLSYRCPMLRAARRYLRFMAVKLQWQIISSGRLSPGAHLVSQVPTLKIW
jgi:cell division protease FtsH